MTGKRRLIWHIFPPFLVIIIIALVAVIFYASISIKHFFVNQTRDDLQARALLIQEQIFDLLEPLNENAIDHFCKTAGQQASTRITIILPNGKVVGDSEADPSTMDNHVDRPEFIRAITETVGSSMRYSRTLDHNYMYVGIGVKKDHELLAVIRTSMPIDVLGLTIKKIQGRIILGGLIITILAALVSLFISRRISQPIGKLKKVANCFSQGDFHSRMPFSSIEEIGDLYEAIKSMAQELHKRIQTIMSQGNQIEAILSSMVEGVIAVNLEERVIRMNHAAASILACDASQAHGRSVQEIIRNSLFQDFVKKTLSSKKPVEEDFGMFAGEERFVNAHGTLLRDAEDHQIGALIVLNDITRLRRLENIRKEFVANVSHEIKTPITAIKGFIETLNDGKVKERQDTKRFLEIIEKHAKRLEAIIEDLLSLSKIEKDTETQGIQIIKSPIHQVLKTAIQVCETKAKAKEINMAIDCEQELSAKINPPLLEQAVVNLIDNAVKYSGPNRTVRVRGSQDDQAVMISVIDEGRGIEKEHLPRLFERFYRVDKARSRQMGGTGLGLAIVKHIAQAHGGHVSVESTPGKGSVFTIHLPKQ
jgi:two-component system phosphate regulon sensor histidine kinase PhoR